MFRLRIQREGKRWSRKLHGGSLAGAVRGKYLAGSGASTVLTMIYNRLGNAKNAVIENLILAKDWTVGKDNCWSQLIKADNMTGNANISSKMASCVSAKQEILNQAVIAWAAADVDVTVE